MLILIFAILFIVGMFVEIPAWVLIASGVLAALQLLALLLLRN